MALKLPVDVPPARLNKMDEPPEVSKFPLLSIAVRLAVTVFPELTVGRLMAKVELVAEILPGVTVTEGALLVRFRPPTVA